MPAEMPTVSVLVVRSVRYVTQRGFPSLAIESDIVERSPQRTAQAMEAEAGLQ